MKSFLSVRYSKGFNNFSIRAKTFLKNLFCKFKKQGDDWRRLFGSNVCRCRLEIAWFEWQGLDSRAVLSSARGAVRVEGHEKVVPQVAYSVCAAHIWRHHKPKDQRVHLLDAQRRNACVLFETNQGVFLETQCWNKRVRADSAASI